MKEVVVDTNVFVSALIHSGGIPRVLLLKIASGEVSLVTSPKLLLEIVSVFARPKLRALIPENRISELVSLIHESARIVKPRVAFHICRDPKDDSVLETAYTGKAAAIITGDHDLLDLNPFRGIPILTPKKFLSLLIAR